MPDSFRYLLLQVRNPGDPMRQQEVRCFARCLACDLSQIEVWDLLQGVPSKARLNEVDVVLLGGSGDYSVAEGGDVVERALEGMRDLYAWNKPTFASCWGFQAIARALGGRVVTDLSRAELGTTEIELTDEARRDPVFGYLGHRAAVQMGHQDIVVELPPDVIPLARSDRVENQAFRISGKPIYCTQFHPELDRKALIERLAAYPQYVERIARMSAEEFCRERCRETRAANRLLRRFIEQIALKST